VDAEELEKEEAGGQGEEGLLLSFPKVSQQKPTLLKRLHCLHCLPEVTLPPLPPLPPWNPPLLPPWNPPPLPFIHFYLVTSNGVVSVFWRCRRRSSRVPMDSA
jgi:hypothetical protein